MDTPETLAADMLKAAGEALVVTRLVVQSSAKEVRDDSRRYAQAANPVHAAGVDRFITYDTSVNLASIDAEIGYEKRGLGNLGAILEYASGGARNNPQRNLGRAMDVREPLFEAAIAAAAEKLL